MTHAIVAEGLSKSFDSVEALRGIELDLAPGSFTAVVGASGSGKTTLLRLLGGLTEPTSGRVEVAGRAPNQVREAKEIGWMAQRPALLPWRTVVDNVALAQSLNPRPDRPQTAPAHLLEMVGLADEAHQYPGSLSGGMQQRAALARTLAVEAPVWLMDEPFSALDELTRETLADDLVGLWRQMDPTVVWVTHHIPEAVKLADRIVLLSSRPGRVVDTIDVDLPRPRDERSTSLQDVIARTRTALRLADRSTLGAAR